MAHVAQRKPPGYVRLINLTSDPLQIKLANPPGYADAPADDASRFLFAKPGPVKVQIVDDKGNDLQAPDFAVETKAAVSILLTDHNGKGSVVEGEINAPEKGTSSVRVIGDTTGLGECTATIKSPTGKITSDKIGLTTGAHQDAPGSYSVKIEDASHKVVSETTITAESEKAYTVAVASDKNGKLVVKTLLNNPLGKPMQMQASAAAGGGGGAPPRGMAPVK